mmetsp:Transcript_19293/g.34167  ORF Transcript_19293/g.34167 Transcript_19293/m.34167 type:complete len:368 (-) Transcript_19293:471-1574(-)
MECNFLIYLDRLVVPEPRGSYAYSLKYGEQRTSKPTNFKPLWDPIPSVNGVVSIQKELKLFVSLRESKNQTQVSPHAQQVFKPKVLAIQVLQHSIGQSNGPSSRQKSASYSEGRLVDTLFHDLSKCLETLYIPYSMKGEQHVLHTEIRCSPNSGPGSSRRTRSVTSRSSSSSSVSHSSTQSSIRRKSKRYDPGRSAADMETPEADEPWPDGSLRNAKGTGRSIDAQRSRAVSVPAIPSYLREKAGQVTSAAELERVKEMTRKLEARRESLQELNIIRQELQSELKQSYDVHDTRAQRKRASLEEAERKNLEEIKQAEMAYNRELNKLEHILTTPQGKQKPAPAPSRDLISFETSRDCSGGLLDCTIL